MGCLAVTAGPFSDGVGVEKLNVNPEDLATGRAIIQTSTETK